MVLPAIARFMFTNDIFTGHGLYLSTVGWCVLVATWGAQRDRSIKSWHRGICYGLLAVYLVFSMLRIQQWSSETLFMADGKAHPGTASAMRAYAAKLRTNGELDEALANYGHSLLLEGGNANSMIHAQYVIAQLYLTRSQFDLAYVQFQEMDLDLHAPVSGWNGPLEQTSFWADFGYVLASVSRYEEALSVLLRAQEQSTTERRPNELRITLRRPSEQLWREDKDPIPFVLNTRGSPFVLNTLGYTLAHLGFPREAMLLFLEALKINENDSIVWNNCGVLAHFASDADKATRSITRAVELNPDNDLFQRNWAALQEAMKSQKSQDSVENRETQLLLGLHYHHKSGKKQDISGEQ